MKIGKVKHIKQTITKFNTWYYVDNAYLSIGIRYFYFGNKHIEGIQITKKNV